MSDWQMTVYRFGVRGDLPAAAVDELRRAHDLKNQLVEIERRHAERVAEIWSRWPEVAAADAQVAAAEQRVAELAAEAAEQRKSARDRAAPLAAAQLRAARAELRAARQHRRDTKALAYAELKAEMLDARAQRRAEIKATYRQAVDAGLYWATYNDVVAQHDVAVRRVVELRKQGRAAELRFKRWTGGEGTLTVQLQRQAGDPQRTPAVLASGAGKWRNVASLTPAHDPEVWAKMTRGEQRRAARGTLRMRIGSGDAAQMIDLPVIVHRPIHPDADITMIRVTRRRVGPQWRVTVSVVARVPAPAPAAGPVAAVHSGWASRGDGSIRVAVAAHPAAPPRQLLHDGIVVPVGAGLYEIVAPAAWRDVAGNISRVQSQRDRNLDALRRWLADQDLTGVDGADGIGRWRNPARFATLAARLRGSGHPAEAMLEAWRRQDAHLWAWAAHESDQLAARRDDTWRNVAAWLAAGVSAIALDDWPIRDLVRNPRVEDADTWQARAARVQQRLAAPGKLRAAVVAAATARGVTLVRPVLGATPVSDDPDLTRVRMLLDAASGRMSA